MNKYFKILSIFILDWCLLILLYLLDAFDYTEKIVAAFNFSNTVLNISLHMAIVTIVTSIPLWFVNTKYFKLNHKIFLLIQVLFFASIYGFLAWLISNIEWSFPA